MSQEKRLSVVAPLSGVVIPLDLNPDPVFAQRLTGDGVCVDPTSSEVLAPVAGQVTAIHRSKHAITIKSPSGVELLTHVGIDTVSLRGEGFETLVKVGDAVKQGQAVLRFDPEEVGRRARSLMTEILLPSGEGIKRISCASGLVEGGKSELIQIELGEPEKPSASAQGDGVVVEADPVELPNPMGLHARPAAVFAAAAQRFSSQVLLRIGSKEANGKSVTAIMMLNSQKGDAVRVAASGLDRDEALAELHQLLQTGCGEDLKAAALEHAEEAPGSAVAAPGPSSDDRFQGLTAAPGLRLGTIFKLDAGEPEVPEFGKTAKEEHLAWLKGVSEAAEDIRDMLVAKPLDPSSKILKVQLSLLDDPELNAAAKKGIQEGKSAAFAWRKAYSGLADGLSKLKSAVLKERAADVRDIGRRVLAKLAQLPKEAKIEIPEGAIVIADEILPSDMAAFDRNRLFGIATLSGSPTSHVSILARNMGVAAVCGLPAEALELANGTPALIDADHGALIPNPAPELIQAAEAEIQKQATRRAKELEMAHQPAKTKDGHRIEVVANIGGITDAKEALKVGAEGVGLLRSEFLFYERPEPPSEDEQAATYTEIAKMFGKDRPFVIRTLDVGGDKPLEFLKLPTEANPFLGMRGVRVSFEHEALFRTQLRAIGRAADHGQVHLMFPMIAGLEDARRAVKILNEELGVKRAKVKVGIMIEVPAAAALADLLAEELDFFSIGTNDLTQYTLAIDRGHPVLAKRADALHPGVLRMIASTARGAQKRERTVAVCGGVASDPLAVPLLVGLGVNELSVSVPVIPEVKAVLAQWTLAECNALAQEVLQLGTTEEIRARLHLGREEKLKSQEA